MDKIEYGKWTAFYFCINCDKEMSFSTMMDSNGVCPYCGHVSGSTVCKTKTKSGRYKYKRTFFGFRRKIIGVEYKN